MKPIKSAREILIARSLIPKGASIHDNSIVLFKEALLAIEEYHAQFETKPVNSNSDNINILPTGFPRKLSEPTQKMGFWNHQAVWEPSPNSLNAAKMENMKSLNMVVPEGTAFCGSRNAFGRCSGCGIELTGEVHCYLLPAPNQMELKLSKDLPEDTFHSQVM